MKTKSDELQEAGERLRRDLHRALGAVAREQDRGAPVPASITPTLHTISRTSSGEWLALFDLSDGRTAGAVLHYVD